MTLLSSFTPSFSASFFGELSADDEGGLAGGGSVMMSLISSDSTSELQRNSTSFLFWFLHSCRISSCERSSSSNTGSVGDAFSSNESICDVLRVLYRQNIVPLMT